MLCLTVEVPASLPFSEQMLHVFSPRPLRASEPPVDPLSRTYPGAFSEPRTYSGIFSEHSFSSTLSCSQEAAAESSFRGLPELFYQESDFQYPSREKPNGTFGWKERSKERAASSEQRLKAFPSSEQLVEPSPSSEQLAGSSSRQRAPLRSTFHSGEQPDGTIHTGAQSNRCPRSKEQSKGNPQSREKPNQNFGWKGDSGGISNEQRSGTLHVIEDLDRAFPPRHDSPPQCEEAPLLSVSPTTPRPLTPCSEVPVITFEGPCFHGLPSPPPPPPWKSARSPLTRRRATVPLIQPSSPVLARRPSPKGTNDRRRETLSFDLAQDLTLGDLGTVSGEVWEERNHRRALTYPLPPASQIGAQVSPTVSTTGSLIGAFPRQPFSLTLPGDFPEEPPALLLPGASASQTFDPQHEGLRSVNASPAESVDLEEFAFWSPRSVLRKGRVKGFETYETPGFKSK